jgi:hypothetical protein
VLEVVVPKAEEARPKKIQVLPGREEGEKRGEGRTVRAAS